MQSSTKFAAPSRFADSLRTKLLVIWRVGSRPGDHDTRKDDRNKTKKCPEHAKQQWSGYEMRDECLAQNVDRSFSLFWQRIALATPNKHSNHRIYSAKLGISNACLMPLTLVHICGLGPNHHSTFARHDRVGRIPLFAVST